MARKKYIQHIAHIPEDKDLENVKEFDLRDFISTGEDSDKEVEKSIKHLYLAPAGYPIKPFDAPESTQLIVKDPKLFQLYAAEQWLGLNIRIDDYIFD